MVSKTLPPEPALSDNLPQQFMRVASDPPSKTTCARTELVYIRPTPEERRALTATTKVHAWMYIDTCTSIHYIILHHRLL